MCVCFCFFWGGKGRAGGVSRARARPGQWNSNVAGPCTACQARQTVPYCTCPRPVELPTPPHPTPSPPARSFLQGLFTLAVDPAPAVRKAVCTGLVSALLAVPERLQPSLPDLIEYMLKSTQVWHWGRLHVG